MYPPMSRLNIWFTPHHLCAPSLFLSVSWISIALLFSIIPKCMSGIYYVSQVDLILHSRFCCMLLQFSGWFKATDYSWPAAQTFGEWMCCAWTQLCYCPLMLLYFWDSHSVKLSKDSCSQQLNLDKAKHGGLWFQGFVPRTNAPDKPTSSDILLL